MIADNPVMGQSGQAKKMIFKVIKTPVLPHGWIDLAERSPKMASYWCLVNGKVANGGRENDRGNLGSRAVGIPNPPSADPLLRG